MNGDENEQAQLLLQKESLERQLADIDVSISQMTQYVRDTVSFAIAFYL